MDLVWGYFCRKLTKKGRVNLSPEKPATTGLSSRLAAEAWQQPRRDIAVKPQGGFWFLERPPRLSCLHGSLPKPGSRPAGGIGGEIYRLLIS